MQTMELFDADQYAEKLFLDQKNLPMISGDHYWDLQTQK